MATTMPTPIRVEDAAPSAATHSDRVLLGTRIPRDTKRLLAMIAANEGVELQAVVHRALAREIDLSGALSLVIED
jgi:hypothetical protein